MVASVNHVFLKKNIVFEDVKGKLLDPEVAFALLNKTFKIPKDFEQKIVHPPPIDGSIFTFSLQTGQPLPCDGYGWMENETVQRVTCHGYEMDIFAREKGFVHGATEATIRRRRYRVLANPDYQLVHYSKMRETAKVDLDAAKSLPRDPASLKAIEAAQFEAAKKKSKQIMKLTIEEAIGDADGTVYGVERSLNHPSIALTRYKQNHVNMDLIFSPHNAESVVGPSLFQDLSKERFDAVRKLIEDQQKEFATQRESYRKSLQSVKDKAAADWKLLDDIRHAKHPQDLDRIESSLKSQFALEKRLKIRKVQT